MLSPCFYYRRLRFTVAHKFKLRTLDRISVYSFQLLNRKALHLTILQKEFSLRMKDEFMSEKLQRGKFSIYLCFPIKS